MYAMAEKIEGFSADAGKKLVTTFAKEAVICRLHG